MLDLRTAGRVSAVGLLVAGVLALLGCRSQPPPSSPSSDRPALRIGLYDAPLGLDPHRHDEFVTFSVLLNIYEGLIRFDSDLRVEAAIAESWENPNDLTWRFQLRPGVVFHDGRPLTMDDVLFSLERALVPGSSVGSYLVAIDDMVAIDDRTLDIVTTRPYPILLNKLARVVIVPAGSPEEIVEPIGTGPYRFVGMGPSGEIELEANERHWRSDPLEARVRLIPIPDATARVEALIGGDLDVATELGSPEVERLEGLDCCHVAGRETVAVTFLLLPTDQEPFDDPRVRRAVHLGLDRQALIDEVFSGRAEPAGQLVGPSVFGFTPQLPPAVFDPVTARRLLEEAGYPDGLELRLEYRSTRPDAEFLRDQLAEVGLRLQLVPSPWDELYPRLLDCDLEGAYLGGFVVGSGDASDLFDGMIHSRDPGRGYGATNFACGSDPELDALIESSGRTLDMRLRGETLGEIMARLMETLPIVPVYGEHTTFGLRSGIEWRSRVDARPLAGDFRRVGSQPR